jgi:hypothetical protein
MTDKLCAEPLLPLVDVIELKWLLAGQGVHLHVERLQRDRAYAESTLALAGCCAVPAARIVASRLLSRLPAA